MKTRALLLASVLLVGCNRGETPEAMAARETAEADSARTEILANNARWVGFVNASQPESLATLFMAGGMVMPPDVPSASGDSLVPRLRGAMIPGGTLTITSQNVSVHGPIAVDRGVFTYSAPAQGRTPGMTLTGKYLAHLHKVDGRWLIAENTWNTDAPTPPAAPSRR
jgi:ketosteroid isomerase-like protein